MASFLKRHTVFEYFKSSRDKSGRSDNPLSVLQAASVSGDSRQPPSNRDLVRVVLRDILRNNGIPSDWIGCHVATRAQPGQATGQQIQLVVQKWHEGLLRYAPVLQQQLLLGLQRFDPTINPAANTVVWAFAQDCGYPYSTMPAPAFWNAPADKPKFDLPPSVRDMQPVDDDFAPTEPSPLR